jgi:putative transposase
LGCFLPDWLSIDVFQLVEQLKQDLRSLCEREASEASCSSRRAGDNEGEVFESFVRRRRNRKAAFKFLKKSMKRHGHPHILVTDKLLSFGAAMKEAGNAARQETGRWLNNRAENSHLSFRRRERAIQQFRSMRSLQKFNAVHASVYNHFNQEHSLSTRPNFKLNRAASLAEWCDLGTA